MEEQINKTCCFIGHRKISSSEELVNRLYKTVEDLILEHNVSSFLFGSKSDFNKVSLSVVTRLREKYPYIKRTYIRAEYQYADKSYTDYLLESYDDTYCPEKVFNAGKASYVERNQIMINKSDCCIFYYDKNYLPPKYKKGRCDLFDYQPKSGTHIAYDYAVQRKKHIINLIMTNE